MISKEDILFNQIYYVGQLWQNRFRLSPLIRQKRGLEHE